MLLSREEESRLRGEHGSAIQKVMEILVAVGDANDAEKMIDMKSTDYASFAWKVLGEAGYEFILRSGTFKPRTRVWNL